MDRKTLFFAVFEQNPQVVSATVTEGAAWQYQYDGKECTVLKSRHASKCTGTSWTAKCCHADSRIPHHGLLGSLTCQLCLYLSRDIYRTALDYYSSSNRRGELQYLYNNIDTVRAYAAVCIFILSVHKDRSLFEFGRLHTWNDRRDGYPRKKSKVIDCLHTVSRREVSEELFSCLSESLPKC